MVLKALRRWPEALACYERAIALRPNHSEAHSNRGNVLRELRQLDAALASYDRALAINPSYAEAHYNRGVVLHDLNRPDDALASYDRAIALRPDYAAAFCNRGVVQEQLHLFEAAVESYSRAVAIQPGFARALANRGNAQRALLQLDAAIDSCDRAIAISPDYAAAYQNRAVARLLAGDFALGWPDYEWRWKNEDSALRRDYRPFTQPQWRGEHDLAGRTLLIHSEQGLGDTIQFCRYVPLLAPLGATVIFEAPSPLMQLLAGLVGVAQLISRGTALPDFDYHCPLMSLPLAFRTTLATVPANVPYLTVDAERRRHWRGKLGERRQPRVGLVWSGGFRADQPEVWSVNSRRNIPLAKLAALRNSDIEFYSLQKGQPAESELAQLNARHWNGPRLIDCTGELHDFADTAALIEQLDLVISVDTSTAHLAGALGKPVWILNRFDTCWRWLLDRTDSPWYPTARLYRQAKPGDWDGVIEQLSGDIQRLFT
ncbi:MAG TPA: tetratricopeptide repeat-containing glycosyltransferase family protein [Candidatus Binataceae bacterium]|nr:tetratricopeptide repeat-containing glycosyltransferase family protein [Candidatus Binataceae bacterium]